MKRLISAALFLGVSTILLAGPVIKDSDKQRAADLVSKMTLDEKLDFISGKIDGFHTCAVERLGIPSVRMADGPQGVRNKTHSTYYPCGLGVAASWNRDIAYGVGAGIGVDAKARGVGIMLCPGVNIYRSALCGRNFEYMGEDPYLASETAASYISGMQDQGTMATIKHFAANNQEFQRHQVGSVVGERTLNEIYFATFRKAVEKAHVGAVMTSYNPLNGTHAAENAWLIKENLRKWGHEGIVMTDWTSDYSAIEVLASGQDLEMPRNKILVPEKLKTLLANGAVDISQIDQMCQHILQTFSAFGLLDNPMTDTNDVPMNEESRARAYSAALEAPVLLKNEGDILPIKGGNIVVMGPNADYIAFGGGSGAMFPISGTTTTLYEGLQQLGKKYKVTYVNGPSNEALIAKADYVIYAGGFDKRTESEGSDRTYDLPFTQNDDIEKVAGINPNTIVVINSGGEIQTGKWLGKVKALIMAWYGGQEGGKALAAIISGAASPSGKLPFTFWGTLEKNPASQYYKGNYPASGYGNRDAYPHSEYREGIFVGYRGVKHFGTQPLFPFGFGLSYSTFEYSGISAKSAGNGYEISFTVKNTGNVEAAEVAELYIAPVNAKAIRPAKELKGYEKVKLAKGESKTVTIKLSPADFAYYSLPLHDWKTDNGEYRILVGSSSADIRLETVVKL